MKTLDIIGESAALELLAEECTELAHACLKLSRIKRGENPTDKSELMALADVIEEMADVMICADIIRDCDWYDGRFEFIQTRRKNRRMEERLERKGRATVSVQDQVQDQSATAAD